MYKIRPNGLFNFGAPLKMGGIWKAGSPLDAYGHWQQIVRVYSGCHLTNERDRLVAISGVAKHFAQLWDMGGYAAGLWRNYLGFQMMWRCRVSGVRPSQDRAPSWSWASINAGIIPLRDHFSHQKLVEVRQVIIDCLTGDPYGEVVNARVEISGHLSTIILEDMLPCSTFCGGVHGLMLERAGGRTRTFSCKETMLALDTEGFHL